MRIHALIAYSLLAVALLGASPATAQPADAALDSALREVATAGYRSKARLVEQLVIERHPSPRAILAALLDNRLYPREADGAVFIIEERPEDQLALTNPVSLAPAGTVDNDGFERIRTNITLRKALKQAIARFDLGDDDATVRAAAVDKMSGDLDADSVGLLRAQRDIDTSDRVRRRIDVALALHALGTDDPQAQAAALDTLDDEYSHTVYNRLQPLYADGAQTPPALRQRARALAERIDARRSVYGWLETLFFGLSLGSVLVLAAIGLAITFGVMGVINMAHGELIMLGAYTTYVLQLALPGHIGLALLLSVPAAFLVSGLVGVGIERGIVRFLYGRPLETLLATFGLSLILQQVVRSIFSPLNRSVTSPEWMQGLLQINALFAVTWNRLIIIVFTALVFGLLWLVLSKTSLGLKVRAVSQNRAMARAMGIRSERVDALTFGLGSGVAGVAGVALSQLTNVGPNLGQAYIVDSFMVVVFGGVGNLWGTLISGLSLGVINKLLEPHAGAVMAKILVLLFLILFIQRKPRGLFPQKGRSAEGH